MIRKWAAAAAIGIVGALALAGTAQAQEPNVPYEVYETDGCQLTIHLTSPAQWRDGDDRGWSVWLVVDTGETVDVVEVAPGEDGSAGPYDLESADVQYRIFGGPERDDDSPAWGADEATIRAHVDEHGDDWVLGGVDGTPEWVTWHTAEVEGCEAKPDPTPTADPTADPTAEPTDDPEPTAGPTETAEPGTGGGGELPVTGGLSTPVALGGAGLAAITVGGVALLLARKRGIPLDGAE